MAAAPLDDVHEVFGDAYDTISDLYTTQIVALRAQAARVAEYQQLYVDSLLELNAMHRMLAASIPPSVDVAAVDAARAGTVSAERAALRDEAKSDLHACLAPITQFSRRADALAVSARHHLLEHQEMMAQMGRDELEYADRLKQRLDESRRFMQREYTNMTKTLKRRSHTREADRHTSGSYTFEAAAANYENLTRAQGVETVEMAEKLNQLVAARVIGLYMSYGAYLGGVSVVLGPLADIAALVAAAVRSLVDKHKGALSMCSAYVDVTPRKAKKARMPRAPSTPTSLGRRGQGGWLLKKSRRGAWQARYFAINTATNRLEYYAGDYKQNLVADRRGALALNNATAVSVPYKSGMKGDMDFLVVLRTVDKKMRLRAPSARDKAKWMRALSVAGGTRVAATSPVPLHRSLDSQLDAMPRRNSMSDVLGGGAGAAALLDDGDVLSSGGNSSGEEEDSGGGGGGGGGGGSGVGRGRLQRRESARRSWVQLATDEGEVYYYNTLTLESVWELPEGASLYTGGSAAATEEAEDEAALYDQRDDATAVEGSGAAHVHGVAVQQAGTLQHSAGGGAFGDGGVDYVMDAGVGGSAATATATTSGGSGGGGGGDSLLDIFEGFDIEPLAGNQTHSHQQHQQQQQQQTWFPAPTSSPTVSRTTHNDLPAATATNSMLCGRIPTNSSTSAAAAIAAGSSTVSSTGSNTTGRAAHPEPGAAIAEYFESIDTDSFMNFFAKSS